MKRILLLSTLFPFFFAIAANAQRTCGSELSLSAIQQRDPVRYQRIMKMEQEITQYREKEGAMSLMDSNVIAIPAVVHVLHTG